MKAQLIDMHSATMFGRMKGRDVDPEEMRACLSKLKDLLPNMPKNKKASKLEIILSVIDYINDLQNTLGVVPVVNTTTTTTSSPRRPLGTIPQTSNTILDNPLEKPPTTTATKSTHDINTRPVTC